MKNGGKISAAQWRTPASATKAKKPRGQSQRKILRKRRDCQKRVKGEPLSEYIENGMGALSSLFKSFDKMNLR